MCGFNRRWVANFTNFQEGNASNAPGNGPNKLKRTAFWPTYQTTEQLLGRILGINGLSEAN